MKQEMNEKMAAKLRLAQQWVEMLRGLADVLDTVVALGETDEEPQGKNRENVYLRPERDEQELRQMVEEALEVSARGGVRHLMRYKYQWYALYRELEQHGWIGRGRGGLSCFCRQMGEWFPDARVGFDYKGVAKGGEHRHDPAYASAERWFRERMA